MQQEERKKIQLISYLQLRNLIGATGLLLPLLLFIGNWYKTGEISVENSISDYHHTESRDLFVGVLFVLGFFLLTYKGFEAIDSKFANFGSVFAIGVALFPNDSPTKWISTMHFVFATLLFLVFIYFSLVLFRKKSKSAPVNPSKIVRNRIYLICGIIMVICVVGIALGKFILSDDELDNSNLIFWLETVALIAFGFSWITKGELFIKDVLDGGSKV